MEGKGGELSGVEQTKRYQTKRLGKKKEKEEEKILQREKKHISYRRLIYERNNKRYSTRQMLIRTLLWR